jgi:hypothetical protein
MLESFTNTAEEDNVNTLWIQSIIVLHIVEKERLELDRIFWNSWWKIQLDNSCKLVPAIRESFANLPVTNIFWQESTLRANEKAIAKCAEARFASLTPEEKCLESYYKFLDNSKLERCCSNWQDNTCQFERTLNRCETDLAIAQRRYAVEQEIDNLYKTGEQLFQDQQP